MHARSFGDPVFQSSYAIEPADFCRGCHAPESSPGAEPTSDARAVGVGCVTCHVENDAIVGITNVPGAPGGHPVLGDARMATVSACAGCHDFDFPLHPGAPMQGTVREHRTSKRATESCEACHMPRIGDGSNAHFSHRFGVRELLPSAAHVSARRESGAIVIAIAVTETGHAFPTGDMFRRLEVRASARGQDGRVIRAAPAVLRREFRVSVSGGVTDRIDTSDSRVPADGSPREARLLFSEDVDATTIHWEIAYQRMGREMAVMFGVDFDQDETIFAEGDLAPLVHATQ
jgi:hypothetical protein